MTTTHEPNYTKLVQSSISNFIHCGEEYLFQKRSADKEFNPNKINMIGGRIETNESHVAAVIRETKEETGYVVTPEDVRFVGLINKVTDDELEPDWQIALFSTEVSTKQVPIGTHTQDGELLFIHQDEVATYPNIMLDIPYYFNEMIKGDSLLFVHLHYDRQMNFQNITVDKLPK